MRILLVSHSFPPYNSVGTVRVGKTAKYLARSGCDVRVLTAAPLSLPLGLPVEIPEDRIHRTRWLNLRAPAERVGGGRAAPGTERRGSAARVRALVQSSVWSAYRQVVGYPDLLVGWLPFAVREGARLCASWRPDVVYASAPPYTSLLVGAAVARRCGVPWVAELRDLWTDTHHYPYSRLRLRLERRTERRVLGSAAGLVTVSEPLADTLRRKYRVPVEVVTNGFDPEDYPAASGRSSETGGTLRLVYTGSIQPAYQDPRPLLEAVASSPGLRESVRVDFYGPRLDFVRAVADGLGVARQVSVHEPVPYRDALRIQREADALLFLSWGDADQPGILTGKLFEYLGARRPILAVGPHRDEAVRLIERLGAGEAAHGRDAVAEALAALLSLKRADGLPDLSSPAHEAFTREAQAARIVEFLRRLPAPE